MYIIMQTLVTHHTEARKVQKFARVSSSQQEMQKYYFRCLCLWAIVAISLCDAEQNSKLLCSQCSKCESDRCPLSEAYPHLTAFDNSLIVGALQSDYAALSDRGVYSVPNIGRDKSGKYTAYFGWESISGAASRYHRFRNYMDKCSGQNYLTVDKQGKVSLRSLSSLDTLAQADWKSINPPKHLNHREFRFWVSRSTGKCLTVFYEKSQKRTVGVTDCRFDGSNPAQLFAFRFHYHRAFCCCGHHNL